MENFFQTILNTVGQGEQARSNVVNQAEQVRSKLIDTVGQGEQARSNVVNQAEQVRSKLIDIVKGALQGGVQNTSPNPETVKISTPSANSQAFQSVLDQLNTSSLPKVTTPNQIAVGSTGIAPSAIHSYIQQPYVLTGQSVTGQPANASSVLDQLSTSYQSKLDLALQGSTEYQAYRKVEDAAVAKAKELIAADPNNAKYYASQLSRENIFTPQELDKYSLLENTRANEVTKTQQMIDQLNSTKTYSSLSDEQKALLYPNEYKTQVDAVKKESDQLAKDLLARRKDDVKTLSSLYKTNPNTAIPLNIGGKLQNVKVSDIVNSDGVVTNSDLLKGYSQYQWGSDKKYSANYSDAVPDTAVTSTPAQTNWLSALFGK
jgi:hypothetical protein